MTDDTKLQQFIHDQFSLHICRRELATALCGRGGRGRQISPEEFCQAVRRVAIIYRGKRPLEKWNLLLHGLQGPDPWALRPTAAEERRKEEDLRNRYCRRHDPENEENRILAEKQRQITEMKRRGLISV